MTNVTLTTEQAQQIEEALEDIVRVFEFETGTPVEALATIRAARAQELNLNCKSVQKRLATQWGYVKADQAEQEPVAYALSHLMGLEFGSKYPMQETKEVAEQMARQHMGAVVVTPLYAAPVRTKDLTDGEIRAIRFNWERNEFAIDFARAVIAADREKNRG